MGTGKKEANRRARQGKTGDGMGNLKVKGENFYRSAKKIKTLNMFKDGKAQRNADGKIVKAAAYQSKDVPTAVVQPDRRWFNNTRVISQDSLTAFREAMAERAKDPYQVLLKSNKLPLSLIRDGQDTNGLKQHRAKIAVESAPFAQTFGPKSQRKRPRLNVSSLTDLAEDSSKQLDTYKERREQARLLSGNAGGDAEEMDTTTAEEDGTLTTAIEPIFKKGQSARIWKELYKVVDSSDVLISVLDARDPLGTRCRLVEKYLKEQAPHKHLIFLLNKIDLVPSSVAASWIRRLQKEAPTCGFRASINNSFGRGSVIDLLRQFSILHKDRKQISVGLIGYPNVGKSSVINTLRNKKVCNVAPIPGETKVWAFISLMKRIYLIDSPGIVPPNPNDSPQDILLRGVVRVENVDNPEQYIPAVLDKVKKHHMERTYELKGWDDHTLFLELLARKSGRLLRGGEPDSDGCAKMVLNDFIRGKIPWFTPPPDVDGEDGEVIEGRTGRLGEMPRKRKREELESMPDTSMGPSTPGQDEVAKARDEEEADFEGFGSDREPGDEDADDADDVISLGVSSDEEERDASDVNSDDDVEEDDGVADDDSGDDSGGESEEGGRTSINDKPSISAPKRRKQPR